MLYIVATPIGNLKDITFRALDCLKSVSYILCEDTRQSRKLLDHYEIATKLVSFHLFNEEKKQKQVIADLQAGKDIALISDAGTPLIEDPGFGLVRECHTYNIGVTALPGPCAITCALTLSGLATCPFQFVGFLPKKTGELEALLEECLASGMTTVCYESPKRIKATLKKIAELDSTRTVALCRELTKRYETCYRGTADEVIDALQDEVLGELVLVLDGKKETRTLPFSEKAIKLLLNDLIEQNFSPKEAMRKVSDVLGIPKKVLYKLHITL